MSLPGEVEITVFAKAGGPLTKQIYLDSDGSLKSDGRACALSTGTASWVFRYELAGKPHEHGLGSVGTFTLDEVREKARKCRQQVHAEIDPVSVSREARQARRQREPFERTARGHLVINAHVAALQ